MLQQRLKIYRRTNENYSHAQGDYFDDMESHAGQGVSGSPDNVHGSWVPVPRFVRGPWCGGSRCDARDGACAEGTGRAQGISGGAEEAPKQEEMRSDHSLGDLTARDRFRLDPATRFFKYCAGHHFGSRYKYS